MFNLNFLYAVKELEKVENGELIDIPWIIEYAECIKFLKYILCKFPEIFEKIDISSLSITDVIDLIDEFMNKKFKNRVKNKKEIIYKLNNNENFENFLLFLILGISVKKFFIINDNSFEEKNQILLGELAKKNMKIRSWENKI